MRIRALVVLTGSLLAALAGAAPPALRAPRIVVMAPSAAEMLAGLGLGATIVGVGDFVTWPPELAARPKVGAYDQPNVERVLALGATEFVTTKSVAGSAAFARLRELGLEVVALDTSTYTGTLDSMRELGERFDRRAQAAAMVSGIEQAFAETRRRAASVTRRRVLFVVGRDPLYAAGPGSHLDSLLVAAGGENVAADAASPYPQLALEAVLARAPEIILDSSDNAPDARRGRFAGPWARWSFLPAVRDGRVYFLDPARLSVPGPRLGAMVELMGKLIHPEIFGVASADELGPLAPVAARSGPAPR
jgi:iron complex transport system substrate-binding protein